MSILPQTMTAITLAGFGGPEMLTPAVVSAPRPKAGEVLIKVAAAGVNRPDVVQREGRYPPPPGASEILGLEIAGNVIACGPGAAGFREGDAVCALVAGGGYAEYCNAPAGQVLPLPHGFDMIQAAALPETFFTVWSNVFDRAALQPGESLLVHGGTSGIGTTAIMLAKAFGATVYATAGSERKCDLARELGADRAINYRTEDFAEVIKDETAGRGVDVILDMVGGDYTNRNIRSLAEEGRLVQIAFLKGPQVEVNLLPVMTKRLTITGSTLRARDVAFKSAIASGLRAKVWPLLEAGKIRPVIDSTFPLNRAADAHERIGSGEHMGKIVLTMG